MRYMLLSLILLWAYIDHCQATDCAAGGLYFCSECENPPVQCISCQAGYRLKADKSDCEACDVGDCADCTADKTKCTTCAYGYYLADDTTCTECDGSCAVCTATECTTCDADTPRVTDGDKKVCEACTDTTYCLKCDADKDTCTECKVGSYLDTSDNSCTPCDTTCAACTATECTTCDADTPHVKDDDKTKCEVCTDTNCAECSSKDTCTTCKATFYLNENNTCTTASSFTTQCTGVTDKLLSCTKCQDGVNAALTDGKCLLTCYLCGAMTDSVPTSSSTECNKEGNVYTDSSPTIQCEIGCDITVKYENGQMKYANRGCITDATCLSEAGGERCTDVGANQTCVKCCNKDKCNSDFYNPSSAPGSHVITVSMLLAAMFTTYIFN